MKFALLFLALLFQFAVCALKAMILLYDNYH
jgi:hypothetical protein